MDALLIGPALAIILATTLFAGKALLQLVFACMERSAAGEPSEATAETYRQP
ncbi:MAG TPA: hypothetical protein VGF59_33035 [Bryobacteraceae bacterium]|jgi:hypothetical protein